jgi:hypothetical protein
MNGASIDDLAAKASYVGLALTLGPTSSWLIRHMGNFPDSKLLVDLPAYDPSAMATDRLGWLALATVPFGVATLLTARGLVRRRAWARRGLETLAWVGSIVSGILAGLWAVAAPQVHDRILLFFHAVAVLMSIAFAALLARLGMSLRQSEVRALFSG